jgi:hypothetical protein
LRPARHAVSPYTAIGYGKKFFLFFYRKSKVYS